MRELIMDLYESHCPLKLYHLAGPWQLVWQDILAALNLGSNQGYSLQGPWSGQSLNDHVPRHYSNVIWPDKHYLPKGWAWKNLLLR